MYYDCIQTLPDNVKAALDDKGQKLWMAAFNATVKKSKDKKVYREAVYDAWNMVKSYEGCRYFSGFVSTEDLDKQNDVVLVDKAYDRIANHIERGGTMVDTHTNRTVGSFYFVQKATNVTGALGIKAYAVVYQGEPYYDTVWQQIKKAVECPGCRDVRKGFSIGGFALDTKTTCDTAGCHRDIIDMSIHEISICQDPANPAAVIQEVNMMAKSEDTLPKGEEEKNIDKALRTDVPDAGAAVPTESDNRPDMMAEAVPKEGDMLPAGQAGAQAKAPLDMKGLLEQMKEAKKWKEMYDKVAEAAATMQMGMAPPQQPLGVAKAEELDKAACGSQSCGCFDDDKHTSVTAETCPMPKELYGDVKDPQVKNSTESFENKDIKADPSAKPKEQEDLMPSKDKTLFKDFKDGVKAEVDKEGKNSSVTEKTEALVGTDDAKIVGKDLKTPGSDNVGTVSNVGDKKKESFPSEGKTSTSTMTDNGDPREKNFGSEGEKLMQKCPGGGKAEIPEELMPMFQEFLQEKGIKIEPEVHTHEIEATLEKTIYVDDDISEIDLMELTNSLVFDSAEAMGKAAMQRLRIQDSMTKMRLAKNLKVVDIAYLTFDDELKKNNRYCGYCKKPVEEKVCPTCGHVTSAMNKAGEGEMPQLSEEGRELYNMPKQSNYVSQDQASKLARKKVPGFKDRRTLSGEAIKIVETGKPTNEECPHCGEQLYRSGRFIGCPKCGYHNVPHSLMRKAWDEYLLSKQAGVAEAAMAAAKIGDEAVHSVADPIAGVFRHAGQLENQTNTGPAAPDPTKALTSKGEEAVQNAQKEQKQQQQNVAQQQANQAFIAQQKQVAEQKAIADKAKNEQKQQEEANAPPPISSNVQL